MAEHAHEHGHGGGHSHAPPDRMTRAFVVGITLNIIFVVSTTEVALTAHLVLPWPAAAPAFLPKLQRDLEHQFGIHHTTIQFEDCVGAECAGLRRIRLASVARRA